MKKSLSKIHVVHIIPTLAFGGAERLVVDLVNHGDRERFRYTIIVLKNIIPLAAEITNPEVRVICVKKSSWSGWFIPLVRELKRLGPDIIHTHLFGGDVWGGLAARVLQIPVVTTEHNLNYGYGVVRNTIKKMLRGGRVRYVACSEAIKKYTMHHYGIAEQNIQVIRSGVDLTRFERVPENQFESPIRFLLLGRLTSQKGQDVALRALAGLTNYPWQVSVVGSGENEQKLRALVAELGLQNLVSFLAPQSNVVSFLEKNNILLMPSRYEGLGVVAMEAMAAGRLVVAAAVDGLKEVVGPERGVLVENNNVQGWREVIKKCLENQEDCRMLSMAGRTYAMNNFSVHDTVKKYEDVYQQICG